MSVCNLKTKVQYFVVAEQGKDLAEFFESTAGDFTLNSDAAFCSSTYILNCIISPIYIYLFEHEL